MNDAARIVRVVANTLLMHGHPLTNAMQGELTLRIAEHLQRRNTVITELQIMVRMLRQLGPESTVTVTSEGRVCLKTSIGQQDMSLEEFALEVENHDD